MDIVPPPMVVSTSTCSTESMIITGEDQAVVEQMARSGVPLHPWQYLCPLLERQMLSCLENFRRTKPRDGENTIDSSYQQKQAELVELLRGFQHAPFTLQRICELIMNPEAHYRTLDSLLRGYEILLSVSSTTPVVTTSEVIRLEEEYRRVKSSALPGEVAQGTPLKRTDTVEMDVE